ncbi:MAG: hypothetical protein CSB34_05235 [Desulfobulbus propionicus]|nr:MAG: hypothetical protein CSB34_05235 [Desulfobulbus propionicus]
MTWSVVTLSVTAMFLLSLASSFLTPSVYAKYWQQLYALYVVMAGTGITIASVFPGVEYPLYNFVDIIFCLFFCYALIRLTFLWAILAGNLTIVIYTFASWFFTDIPPAVLLNHVFFILGINILGIVVNYALEYMARRDFILNELLREEQEKTANTNMQLEQMVKDRTSALRETNQNLRSTLNRERVLVHKLEQEEEGLKQSLTLLEQAEKIARLGYYEINWKTQENNCSKGFRSIFKIEDTAPPPTYGEFTTFIHDAERPQVQQQVQDFLTNKEPISVEFSITDSRQQVRQLYWYADNVHEESGAPMFSRGVVQDITQRKKAEFELKEIEKQLLQAQKLESIGRLAGGVAHDYNNISSIIIGYAELAIDKLGPNHPICSNLEGILQAATRSSEITRQLLAFAKKQTIAPKTLNLNITMKGMLKMLKRLIGENIDLAWIPGENIWSIKIDPSQIDQILANLCVNARDAIAGVGKITIETENTIIDETYCKRSPDAVPGEYVLLAVSDNGSGIEKEHLDSIFEPFFTTKGLGTGTGLGLATIHGIVKQNNGFIHVYSEPGQGTSFKIYLPRCYDNTIEVEQAQDVCQLKGSGETILVVEDDASILELTKDILESKGYCVLAAGTPSEAIRLAETESSISLLLTDVIMPEMNGKDLAVKLRENNPELKVLYMSGYTADVIAHHGVLERGVQFINKPYTVKELSRKISEVIRTPYP